MLDDGRVVRRAHDRYAPLARDPGQKLADRERVRIVEPRGGLVREQEVRLRGESAGDGDALLFSRREPRDALFGQLLEPDQRKRLLRLAVVPVRAAQTEEELDVLADAQERDERRLLGDEREPVPAERRAAGTVELVDPFAEDDNLAGAREVEPRQQVQQCRLPRARRAGNHR